MVESLEHSKNIEEAIKNIKNNDRFILCSIKDDKVVVNLSVLDGDMTKLLCMVTYLSKHIFEAAFSKIDNVSKTVN